MRQKKGSGKSSRKTDFKPHQLLNEAPDVIGRITAVLENGGSIESSFRDVASNGPKHSSGLFRKIVEDADLRVEADMKLSASRLISSLPENCSAYAMSLRMAMSASDTADADEKSRILKEASEIALNGLREEGKTFCSSLNTPCMVVFGLGIMVPLVLMSVMPMMNMSGMFGKSAMDTDMLVVLTLVLIPGIVLSVILGISEKNPLKTESKSKNGVHVASLFAFVPIFFVYYNLYREFLPSFCIAVVNGAILSLAFTLNRDMEGRRNAKLEKKLQDAVFEIGNRLLTGESFESAVFETIVSRKDCEKLAVLFRNELDLCRGDVESAIRSVFAPVSEEITEAFVNIRGISVKDPRDAGKLAISLGRQMKDRDSLRKSIRNELKSMTDTMFGTAAVFAPLVLGLSVSMLKPMEGLVANTDASVTSSILAVYLVELCGLIALMLSFLEGNCSGRDIVHRYAMLAPISVAVFYVSVNIGF